MSKSGTASAEPGLMPSQGAFMLAGEFSAFGGYPSGTTDNWVLSRSCAVLQLPSYSNILYAELIWAGTAVVSQGVPSVVIADPVLSANVELNVQSAIGNEEDDAFIELDSERIADTLIYVGDIVTYTIKAVNIGNAPAVNCVIQIEVPDSGRLVPGSFMVDESPQTGDFTFESYYLGSIAPGRHVTLTYRLQIVALPQLPEFTHSINVHYATKTPDGYLMPFSSSTKTDVIQFHPSRPDLSLQFTGGPFELTVGKSTDIVLLLWNTGAAAASHLRVSFKVPSGLSIVPTSVLIDGMEAVSDDPIAGVRLEPVEPGQEISVVFKIYTAFRPFADQPMLLATLHADLTDLQDQPDLIEPIQATTLLHFKMKE